MERWGGGVLHGVTPGDPLAYGVTLLTIAIAAPAGFVRAQRAASVNPIAAIRAK